MYLFYLECMWYAEVDVNKSLILESPIMKVIDDGDHCKYLQFCVASLFQIKLRLNLCNKQ